MSNPYLLQGRIYDATRELLKNAGYKFDGFCNMDTQDPKVAECLGRLLHDYLVGAQDAGWEGFNGRQLNGVERLIKDMNTYLINKD